VVDDLLGAPDGSGRPSAILRHDCDDALHLEQWEQWGSKLGLPSVTLLRAPLRPGERLADGSAPEYVMPPPEYDIGEPRISAFVERGRARGCEFGLHYASARPEVVRAEAARFEEATGLRPPYPASAHWLQSSGETIRALDALGVSHDFSFMDYASYAGEQIPVGAPAHPGFATGTTHAHRMWDTRAGRWLNLIAIPGALEEDFIAGRCPTVPDPEDIEAYLEFFARYRGTLVLNWHTERWDLLSQLEDLVHRLWDTGFTFITPSRLPVTSAPTSGQIEVEEPRVVAR
jgi:hypothetical protein